jgi:RNA polymerase sigma-70 factor (ECF subfamily)
VEERLVIENYLVTGSEEAFCALFEAVCARVRRYFLLRGLDAATADDLTQNVFVKVFRGAAELRDADHFYGWLFAIARNEMISFWRGQRARIETVDFESLGDQPGERLAIEPEVMPSLRLMDWLRALEPAERDLIVLRFVEGLSYEELAGALKLPLGTVKWRIFNARKKLARIIGASSTDKARQRIK